MDKDKRQIVIDKLISAQQALTEAITLIVADAPLETRDELIERVKNAQKLVPQWH